jgi:hypothetical protein
MVEANMNTVLPEPPVSRSPLMIVDAASAPNSVVLIASRFQTPDREDLLGSPHRLPARPNPAI